ncbi:hypothetical protein B7494_g8168 [Chlorociboria aeruginascens]|nr:hypothetical protein B7494_g8168 [Chlorociboria aeruginascens]
MKFAKELERDLVPEWRIKYLDYKGGKKRVKAVERAVNRMNRTPQSITRSNITPQHNTIYGSTSPYFPRKKGLPKPGLDIGHDESLQVLRHSPAALGSASNSKLADPSKALKRTPPMTIPSNERSLDPSNSAQTYGSFVPTPTNGSRRSFELPDAALSTISSLDPARQPPRPTIERSSISVSQTPYEIGPTTSPQRATFASLRRSTMNPQNVRPFLRRVFSVGTPLSKAESHRLDIDMIVIDQVKAQKKEFFGWMDKELDKIETFYKAKEDEASSRLDILREQLHIMRYRRLEEVAAAKQAKEAQTLDSDVLHLPGQSNGNSKTGDIEHHNPPTVWLNPFGKAIGGAKAKVLGQHPGSNSEAFKHMSYTPAMLSKSRSGQNQPTDDNRDYVRRPHEHNVSYRTAKRKLKLALQEFYRGMELLKAYALLNRTAFRKINKKYDKAVNAQYPLRYMSEKVNDAWFVKSESLDKYIHQTEDLYARYFERGNRKVATGKLRSSLGRPADQSTSTFTNGVLIGTGAVFAIQGVIYGADLLHHQDPNIQVQTSYLLQIYGDPIFRFNWVFYSIYTQDLQHSTAVSFFIGFSEVTRRGIWTLFRVENEHCSNVALFKASRDVPLPYEIDNNFQESFDRRDTDTSAHVPRSSPSLSQHRASASGTAEAQGSGEGMRYRAPTRAFTTVLAEAHRQDFEKKRKPGAGDSDNRDNMIRDGDNGNDDDDDISSDEDDEEDQQDVLDAEVLIRERSGQMSGSRSR